MVLWKAHKYILALLLIVTIIGFSPQKNIRAQSCTGTTACCKEVPQDCICTRRGEEIAGTCFRDKDTCGPDNDPGTCSCTVWCDTKDAPPGSCSGGGCTASCPAGYIVYATTCLGVPTPTSGGGGCGTSAPTNLAVNWNYSGNRVRFGWTPSTGGVSQSIGVSEDPTDVDFPKNCNSKLGANCVLFEQGLPPSQTSFTVSRSPTFTPGTTYYWAVVNVAQPLSCSRRTIRSMVYTFSPTATNTPVPPTPTNTPVPVGAIRARAVQVDSTNTSCADVFGVPTTDGQINGAVHQFTPSSASQPAAKTQPGARFVIFSNVTTGSYTLAPNPPSADWVLRALVGAM